ncbi:MAG: DNA phosphorothioation-associated putative methyltransferase [Planctomycetota bacterium]|nr:DNA phosphorothioation-associated putative methyltransferase [Planctomycetota bacterium]
MSRGAIPRGRTAIRRTELSRPVQSALDTGALRTSDCVLDYGCGRGDDVRRLTRQGFDAVGWDPAHATSGRLEARDFVNLGFVLNVIEDPTERVQVLRAAWQLSNRVLSVAVQLVGDDRGLGETRPFGDGVLTSRGTFQKFFRHTEVREWIDAVLDTQSVSAAPGIYFVFRREEDRHSFMAARFRCRAPARLRACDELMSQHEELLRPLISFYSLRGRLPQPSELPETHQIEESLGSVRQAFAVIRRATGPERWQQAEAEAQQDLLVYLCHSMFGRTPRFSDLPDDLRFDVRAFFGNYTKALDAAGELLAQVGDQDNVHDACRGATLGKETPKALYIHRDAIDRLPTLLRIYEACARGLCGEVEGANIIKLHRWRPQVSYLCYPKFDRDAHPALARSVVVTMDRVDVSDRDYSASENPPILHRKEEFVPDDYPGRGRFARLTQAEEKLGLYENTSQIGLMLGWRRALEKAGVEIRGHRVTRA